MRNIIKIVLIIIVYPLHNIFKIYLPIKWICWFSSKYFDIHDYPKELGGDGCPTHFYTYNCYNCNRKFSI